MRKLLNILVLFFVSFSVIAASNSNPGLYYGQVPTAAQWNSYFSSKLDYSPGANNNLPYWDGSGNLLAAPVTGSCTFTAGTFDCATSNLDGGTIGAIPYQSAPGATAFLSGNTTTTPQFVTSTGTGAAAQAPTLTGSTGTGSVVLAGNPTLTGNLNFSGSGARITGDFTNATPANRVMFQTSTVNDGTTLSAIPNGTGTVAAIGVINNSSASSASFGRIRIIPTSFILESTRTDAGGTFLPIDFYTNATVQFRLDTSGNFLSTGGGGIGYGTGSGGTVTQLTSKSTAVTLNKPSGRITMNNAALAANTLVSFQVNNSAVTSADIPVVAINFASGQNYSVRVEQVNAGNFWLGVKNETAGSLSDAVVINFGTIKGSIN